MESKNKASQKLAGVTGGIGDETRQEQASVTETREDRVPRSGMLNASEEKRKIKLRRQHYLRQKESHRITLEHISGGVKITAPMLTCHLNNLKRLQILFQRICK